MDTLAEAPPATLTEDVTIAHIQAAFDNLWQVAEFPTEDKPSAVEPQFLHFDNEHTGRRTYFKALEGIDVEDLLVKLEAMQEAKNLKETEIPQLELLKKFSVPYNMVGNRDKKPEFMTARKWHELRRKRIAPGERLKQFQALKDVFPTHRELIPPGFDPNDEKFDVKSGLVPLSAEQPPRSPSYTPFRVRIGRLLGL